MQRACSQRLRFIELFLGVRSCTGPFWIKGHLLAQDIYKVRSPPHSPQAPGMADSYVHWHRLGLISSISSHFLLPKLQITFLSFLLSFAHSFKMAPPLTCCTAWDRLLSLPGPQH